MASDINSDQGTQRAARLSKLFFAYTKGDRTVKTSSDTSKLLEAICARDDNAACVEHLVASDNAMKALRAGLRFDLSARFLNGPLTDFLAFLSHPSVKQVCNGELLSQLITIVVRPPTLWNALVSLHADGQTSKHAELPFAWLLFELALWTDNPPIEINDVAADITARKSFLDAEDPDIRRIGYRLRQVLQAKTVGQASDPFGPGGRHDNDHSDYRKVAILPTDDELLSEARPFYRRATAMADQDFALRPGLHLDNQFRLLREDFLAELREDLKLGQGKGKGRRPKPRLQQISLENSYCGTSRFRTAFAVAVRVGHGLEPLKQLDCSGRKKYLKDNPKFLKHLSFGCVVNKDRIVSFATLLRDEPLLKEDLPLVVLQTPDRQCLEKLLTAFKTCENLDFVMVDTSVFAYEPVLHCLQQKIELPLSEELFASSPEEVEAAVRVSPVAPVDFIDDIESDKDVDLEALLSMPRPVNLDASQMRSFIAGLLQSVSLIQGPPGTGKSFIGALLAKALYTLTREKILVVCYTNHALDQFLEDLLDSGIQAEDIVRLGAKCSSRTKPLQLSEQTPPRRRPYDLINSLNDSLREQENSLQTLISSLKDFKSRRADLLGYLEFSEDDAEFFSAFEMPSPEPGQTIVGSDGKPLKEHYLLDRWRRGEDAGVFADRVLPDLAYVWAMDKTDRGEKIRAWEEVILRERVEAIGASVTNYNRSEATLREAWAQGNAKIIQSKRIIACTTTAAAKYTKTLSSANPGIVLVEEAGEILESHILTAMSPSTKQLILIGDHQQLRPKVKNYALTVEKGDGFDLNRSLFERLILSGFPHTTLHQQHRMCPEISTLVRELTYPDLTDAPSTALRDPIKGLTTRVAFVDHRHPELAISKVADRRDEGATASKQNGWEVDFVLKTVRYIAQQGYGTADQVVLTPYLGQLNLLRQELAQENDPVLNDLDSFDLIKAGLMSASSAQQTKQPIRISTIDNYQGEESDVVIVSLTRSNDNGDIGFMFAPERLNVLLSRARKALILIGNSQTFLASRRGKGTWRPLFEQLSQKNLIFDGLPVKCEQHPDRQAIVTRPDDFDELCPDGGCSAPCTATLNCGIHECPRKCHGLADHSKMRCLQLITDICPRKHTLSWICADLHPTTCPTCDVEDSIVQRQKERDAELDRVRQSKQQAYAKELAEIKDEMDHLRRQMRENREECDMRQALLQHQSDLEAARQRASQMAEGGRASQALNSHAPNDNDKPNATANDDGANKAVDNLPTVAAQSPARDEWEHLKQFEGAQSAELDELMGMIGLENVKEAFLEIKSRIDLTVRQGFSIEKERFGVSLLGNPGTGKTTVARLFAKFLSNVGALPGSHFVETTGAKLANEGVSGCKKILDNILNSNGGALFIDEAYQLTSGSNTGGPAVLDYLLAEVENLTGKVVFILAGYERNMEKFFAHNLGLPSRFPRRIVFADYEDQELVEIMNYALSKRYRNRMVIQGGSRGLYIRIVARRVGRGRGKIGFGNARAIENALSRIADRQAKRVRRERRNRIAGVSDLLLTKVDLIGPEPSAALTGNKSWNKLHKMTGLKSVKDAVQALFDSIQFNYARELAEEPLIDFSLSKVFLGSPGTGKTTVGKLYAQILADIGMLSTNEVVIKAPADFVGSHIGESEEKTKAILDAAIGKVLIIDEAYGLNPSSGGTSGDDVFRRAIIDTIVAEVQYIPGDDRSVLLLGYRAQMEEMFQKSNPGLSRRFPLASAFEFEDFDDNELALIFDEKMKSKGHKVAPRARVVALEMLSVARNRPNFGNAGEVDIILDRALLEQQKRIKGEGSAAGIRFEPQDFDPGYQRAESAHTNVDLLFQDVIGCENIVAQLKGYQTITARLKEMGMDPREDLPFTFLFRGPPGTGKTTCARKMGKVFFDMGFLADASVKECSAKDLIGEYVGQTAGKAATMLESALGRVLFIDEAYRLGTNQGSHNAGQFAQEAVDELVDCITKPRFLNKIVIILAGYEHDINRLMSANPGLSSRFPEVVDFQSLAPADCYEILRAKLAKKPKIVSDVVAQPSASFRDAVLAKFSSLSRLESFANARDIETLAKELIKTVLKNPNAALAISEDMVFGHIDQMIAERASRARSSRHACAPDVTAGARQMPTRGPPPPSQPQTSTDAPTATQPTKVTDASEGEQSGSETDDSDDDAGPPSNTGTSRDAGVSDADWHQLQADARRAEEEEKERERLADEAGKFKKWLQDCADAERQRELDELERKRVELEEKKRKEAKARDKLAKSGLCPAGFRWIRQNGGYRCAGGAHFVPDGQVDRL